VFGVRTTEDAEMSTTIREGSAVSRLSKGQDFVSKRFALLAIRLLVSVNLLYAAIFLKFAGVPGSVALFTQMSQAVHGLVSQPVFRLGSGAFETMVAVLLLIPKTARLGARLTVVWMTAVILSHIFVLGYGWFFIDALAVMLLAVIYLLLKRRHSHWGEAESVGTMAAVQTYQKYSGEQLEAEPHCATKRCQ
jgi:chromate transport protein ChrA